MSELKKKYERILDERVQKCMTDDCLEDMVEEVFGISQLEEVRSVVKRIFPDMSYSIEQDRMIIPDDKRKTLIETIGNENYLEIRGLIPQNTEYYLNKFLSYYSSTSNLYTPKKRYGIAKANMMRMLEDDPKFTPKMFKYFTLPILEEFSLQFRGETLEKAFERHLAQNRPPKGDPIARKDYNKLKMETKRVLTKLTKLSREKGGFRTDLDVEKVMNVIREGLIAKRDRRDQLKDKGEDNDVKDAVDKVIGVYSVNDKLQMRLSNHPIDLFTVGEGQVWTKSACTSYLGVAPWDKHLSDDIKWNNVVAYLERKKDEKVYARASMRWCVIPVENYKYAETMFKEIINYEYKELSHDEKDLRFPEFLNRVKTIFKQKYLEVYPKDMDNFVIDLANHYCTSNNYKVLEIKYESFKKLIEAFADSMLESMGYISFGIEPIWYNIGVSNPQALKLERDGGCGQEQRKMPMTDDCLMPLNIAPNLTGYQASIALVNIIKSQGFQTDYGRCATPYYFHGYSDENDGGGEIEYETVAKRFGDGKESTITMEELYAHYTKYISIHTKYITRCPNCGKIIEWLSEISFEEYLDEDEIAGYILKQFYNTYLNQPSRKYDIMLIWGKDEHIPLFPYSEQGNMQYGVGRGSKCRFCRENLNQAYLSNHLEYYVEPLIDKYFDIKDLFGRQKLMNRIKDDILSDNPVQKISWIRINEQMKLDTSSPTFQLTGQLLYVAKDQFSSAPEEIRKEEALIDIYTVWAKELGIPRKEIITWQNVRQHIRETLEKSEKVGVSRCPVCESIQGWSIQGLNEIEDLLLDSQIYINQNRHGRLKPMYIEYNEKDVKIPINNIKLLGNEFGVRFSDKCYNCGARIKTNNTDDFAYDLIQMVARDIWNSEKREIYRETDEYPKLKEAVIDALFAYPAVYPIKFWDLWEHLIQPDTTSLKTIFGANIIIFSFNETDKSKMGKITVDIARKIGIKKEPLKLKPKKKLTLKLKDKPKFDTPDESGLREVEIEEDPELFLRRQIEREQSGINPEQSINIPGEIPSLPLNPNLSQTSERPPLFEEMMKKMYNITDEDLDNDNDDIDLSALFG